MNLQIYNAQIEVHREYQSWTNLKYIFHSYQSLIVAISNQPQKVLQQKGHHFEFFYIKEKKNSLIIFITNNKKKRKNIEVNLRMSLHLTPPQKLAHMVRTLSFIYTIQALFLDVSVELEF